jgi:hypothetical protein
MISKSDLQNAHRDLVAEGRGRIEPPTVEQVEALFRGDLAPADAERVREQLAYYPDMAKAMTDRQLSADLAAIDAETHVAAPVEFRKRPLAPLLAVAAGLLLVIVLGGVYLQIRQHSDPRPVVTRVLDADGQRGGPAIPGARGAPAQTPIQLSTGTDYVLKPLFAPQRTFDDYRLELVGLDTNSPRPIWTREGLRRENDGSFPAELSTAKIVPGLYELALYGVSQGRAERLATYTIRFSAP